MCDLNRISRLLIVAKIAYIGVLITLEIALINFISFFAAAANTGLLLTIIAVMAVVNVCILYARNELERCIETTCSQELENMIEPLMFFQMSLLAFTVILIGLAIVATMPFEGATAFGGFLAFFCFLIVLLSARMLGKFAYYAWVFNTCRAMAGETRLNGVLIVLAYVAVFFLVALFLTGGGWCIAMFEPLWS